ncbi:MAG TPA: hypothetical protein VGF07_02050 [Stellaceae bacterium]
MSAGGLAREPRLPVAKPAPEATRPEVLIDFGNACPAGADRGLVRFLETAVRHFAVAVWWAHSAEQEGRALLRGWLGQQLLTACRGERPEGAERRASDILRRIGFPAARPPGLALRVGFESSVNR